MKELREKVAELVFNKHLNIGWDRANAEVKQFYLSIADAILALFPPNLEEKAIKKIMDNLAEFGHPIDPECNLPPLAADVYGWIIELYEKANPGKYCSCEMKDPADDGSSKCMNCGLKINFKPIPKAERIEELDYGELCNCDYGDTDRITDHILTLAKKTNELIHAHNRKEAGE